MEFLVYIWVIDQAWGQDGWILIKFFSACLLTETVSSREIHKHAKKKERGQYPSILTHDLLIKDLLYGVKENQFLMRDTARNPEWAW